MSVAGVKLHFDRTMPGLFQCHEYLIYTLAVFADRVFRRQLKISLIIRNRAVPVLARDLLQKRKQSFKAVCGKDKAAVVVVYVFFNLFLVLRKPVELCFVFGALVVISEGERIEKVRTMMVAAALFNCSCQGCTKTCGRVGTACSAPYRTVYGVGIFCSICACEERTMLCPKRYIGSPGYSRLAMSFNCFISSTRLSTPFSPK